LKKRIAILATYVGEIDRGAETLAIEFTKKLRNKYDITVFSKGISQEIKDNTIKIDYRYPFWLKLHKKLYYRINIFYKICNKLYYLIPDEIEQCIFSSKVYRKYLSNGKFDLIFPINGIWGARAALKVRNNFKTPFIYTGCAGISVGEKKILQLKPDTFFSLNSDAYDWAKKYFPKVEKTTLAVNPEDFKKYLPIKEEDSKLEKPVVLCVAAFTQMKRQKLLIDAMEVLGKGTLILIGDGEMKKEIKEYGKKKLKHRFVLKSVKYKELNYYYNICDLFSLPSLAEGGGTVLFESLASNKPVVSTDDALRREVVGEAGILCNVENSLEYANAISKCYNIKWSNIPEQRAENNFSWDKIARDYEKVIDNLFLNKTE
jgi:glycosyltransferase involved in cell wall biosynthesis